MNKQKRREYICIGALMAVAIPLMIIMTKLTHEIVVQGKSVEIVKQYEPVCYCLLGLVFVIGIISYYILGDVVSENNKNDLGGDKK